MSSLTTSNTSGAADPAAGFRHQPPSLYVHPPFYDWLAELSLDWAQPTIRDDAGIDDGQWRRIAQLLAIEARLLDQQAFERWLELYAPECAYWIPASWPAADPRASITLEFHDRRRLLDRVTRLGTGRAYSQMPASRTARQWSGLEAWASPGRDDEWRVRYSFSLTEWREGRQRRLAGWCGFALRQLGSELRIVVKQINLIDCDGLQGNNSFFL